MHKFMGWLDTEALQERCKEAGVGWASKYIEVLQRGEFVKFRPRGNSMSGKIEGGQLVTVALSETAR